MKPYIDNDHVIIGETKLSKSGHLPKQIIESEKTVLVLFRKASNAALTDNRNVFAFDLNGKSLWQIDEATHGGGACPFVDLTREKDEVIGYNWNGIAYKIDVSTGAISPSRLTK